MKLLLVEDDIVFAKTLQATLRKKYIVEWSSTAQQAEYLSDINEYDLFLLDVSLPDSTGDLLCSSLRKNGCRQPILMLTGNSEIESKVRALDAGADDYLTKPFHTAELFARIRALLRRPIHQIHPTILTIDDVTLDTVKKSVTRMGRNILLRPKEFELLELMIRNKGAVITRKMILDHLWDDSYDSLTNTIDVHVKYLRDRIDRPFSKKLIKTVHGLGYKIEE